MQNLNCVIATDIFEIISGMHVSVCILPAIIMPDGVILVCRVIIIRLRNNCLSRFCHQMAF